ncbi:MAG: phenylalanine--tRNA ligase subunit beta [Kiritimatiellia bacterium]
MKVPLSWLKEFVSLPDDVEDLVGKLTFSGIEVEGVTRVGEGLDGVVVGKVLDWQQHPNADRLRLCRVDAGAGAKQVVCGATNFAKGDLAAFAPAGTVLPNGMKLKVAKVRGEVSEGMLCAEDELGFSDAHDGIFLLPATAVAGEPLTKHYPPETVLALEITWNRPDCLSIRGIARELAALYGLDMHEPEGAVAGTSGRIADLVKVRIEDADACPRYTAHLLQGVTIMPSPAWVQRRLQLCGIRPINNIVDATNYVMLEYGQPLHAFDFRFVKGGEIVVRRARAGETIETLDEVTRKLDPDMLVIADAGGPVAVAGVMGGAGSEIRPDTHDVLIESAGFDARVVRAASVRLGLASESSHRFERGVDDTASALAGCRAMHLMQAWGGGVPVAGLVDVYPRSHEAPVLRLHAEKLRKVLGITVPDAEVENILESLRFGVTRDAVGIWNVQIPSFRRDVTCEADLIEEIARMHGIDAVPERLPVVRIVAESDDAGSRAVFRCRELLAGAGLSEAMHYSFLPASLLDAWNGQDAALRLVLPNPVSADQGVMRNSLIPQLVESLARNKSRQIESAALFETGAVYWRAAPDAPPMEEMRLGMAIAGRLAVPGRQDRSPVTQDEVYFTLKGILEQLACDLHVANLVFTAVDHAYCEEGKACRVFLGAKDIGFIGLVRKDVCRSRRLSLPVAVAEISLSKVLVESSAAVSFAPIPSYPSVSRDFAACVDESVTHAMLVDIIQNHAPAELTGVALFDIFRGEELEQGKKSMGYSLTYQSATKTLTDEEVNRLHDGVKNALRREAGVQFRE